MSPLAFSSLGSRALRTVVVYVLVLALVVGLMHLVLPGSDWTGLKILIVLAGPTVLLFTHLPLVFFILGAAIPLLFLELGIVWPKARVPLVSLAAASWIAVGILAVV
jgi:hypothetical protein